MSIKVKILADLEAEAVRLAASNDDVTEWVGRCASSLRRLYGQDSPEFAEFARIDYVGPFSQDVYDIDQGRTREAGLNTARALLAAWKQVALDFDDSDRALAVDRLRDVLAICEGFHRVAQRLRHRGMKRDPLLVEDEWDGQYVLAALLAAHFDDIAEEDPAPTMAGASSRIDFVLRPERIAVEMKMTRKDLSDKLLGEQLMTDIVRYKAHAGVDTLVCLVHDPERFIRNRRGLETDLGKQSNGELRVIVVIR